LGHSDSNTNSVVLVNNNIIQKFTFSNYVLEWHASDGNPNSAVLNFTYPDPTSKALQSFAGVLWASGSQPGSNNISGTNTPTKSPLSSFTGLYQDFDNQPNLQIVAPQPTDADHTLKILWQGQAVTGFSFNARTLTWGSNSITFNPTSTNNSRSFKGTVNGAAVVGTSVASYNKHLVGQYHQSTLGASNVWVQGEGLYYDGTKLIVGSAVINNPQYANNMLSWSTSNGNANNGSLQFTLDGTTLFPVYSGVVWASGPMPTQSNMQGTLNTVLLNAWAGTYAAQIPSGPGPTIQITGNAAPAPASVYVDGTLIPNPNYNLTNSTLACTIDSAHNFSVVFALNSTTNLKGFAGNLITSGASVAYTCPSVTQDITQNTGSYGTFQPDAVGTFTVTSQQLVISGSASSFTVTVGGVAISKPAYNQSVNALVWSNVTGTPDSNAFCNAAITFAVVDGVTQFMGSFWGSGAQPPAKPNWKGSIARSGGGGGGGTPWWVPVVVTVGIGALTVAGVVIYRMRQVGSVFKYAKCKV
jgi:hypothetical protein